MFGFRRSSPAAPAFIAEPEIPPPEINYNGVPTADPADYVRQFKEEACLRHLPFLMRRGLTPDSALLDFGCGLGRLAYAASKYLSSDGAYYGYEPNADALGFLRRAYAGRSNFTFDGQTLRAADDYIAVTFGDHRGGGVAAGNVDFSFVDRPVHVQWSCSVFTHMWQQPIVETLRATDGRLAPGGLCINTWLCIDDFAAYVLRCGLADRTLPYQVNGAFTYSQSNPLVCVAYPLDAVRAIYDQADHEIVEILWGSWTGRDNGAVYQDIVISKPR